MNILHSKITKHKEISHWVKGTGTEQKISDSNIKNWNYERKIYLICWKKLKGSMKIWA